MDEIDDMGWLAEDACRELAMALSPGTTDAHRLREALRRFMHEAKKSSKEIVQPPGGWPPMNGRGF